MISMYCLRREVSLDNVAQMRWEVDLQLQKADTPDLDEGRAHPARLAWLK